MIVDPDFLDHWRTGMVSDALGDTMAPMYILRLWAHCQERKSDTFTMPTRGLKAQCKFPGDAQVFEAALIDAGFVERDGDTVKVCNLHWLRTGRVLDVKSTEWERLRAATFERDGEACVYCGASEVDVECDHVIPLSRGGVSALENLATACVPCNRSKGAKLLSEWLPGRAH